MPNVRAYTVLASLPEPINDLKFIAENMFWSWNPDFVALFRRIDPELPVSHGIGDSWKPRLNGFDFIPTLSSIGSCFSRTDVIRTTAA